MLIAILLTMWCIAMAALMGMASTHHKNKHNLTVDELTADGITGIVSKIGLSFNDTGALAVGATKYLRPNSLDPVATEKIGWVAPFDCSITSLYVNLDTAPSSGETVDVTVRKNGGDGNNTCQIAGTDTSANDTAHTDSISAGDKITIKYVTSDNGGQAAADISIGIGIEYSI